MSVFLKIVLSIVVVIVTIYCSFYWGAQVVAVSIFAWFGILVYTIVTKSKRGITLLFSLPIAMVFIMLIRCAAAANEAGLLN